MKALTELLIILYWCTTSDILVFVINKCSFTIQLSLCTVTEAVHLLCKFWSKWIKTDLLPFSKAATLNLRIVWVTDNTVTIWQIWNASTNMLPHVKGIVWLFFTVVFISHSISQRAQSEKRVEIFTYARLMTSHR